MKRVPGKFLRQSLKLNTLSLATLLSRFDRFLQETAYGPPVLPHGSFVPLSSGAERVILVVRETPSSEIFKGRRQKVENAADDVNTGSGRNRG